MPALEVCIVHHSSVWLLDWTDALVSPVLNVMFHSVSPSFWPLMNLSFLCPFIRRLVFVPRFTVSHVCPILDHMSLGCSPWPVWVPSPSSLHVAPCLGSIGPFRLEIIECTVAPVAMEDSDHEVQSSSDERDSCPASPNHSRGHNADQVLAIPCDLP